MEYTTFFYSFHIRIRDIETEFSHSHNAIGNEFRIFKETLKQLNSLTIDLAYSLSICTVNTNSHSRIRQTTDLHMKRSLIEFFDEAIVK